MGNIILARVYDDLADIKGTRILVDRLWPRGISKKELKLDYWAKEVAPSTKLRKDFNHEEEKFPAFKEEYLRELAASEEAKEFLQKVKGWLEHEDVLLLYSAKSRELNQAVVLKDWLTEEL